MNIEGQNSQYHADPSFNPTISSNSPSGLDHLVVWTSLYSRDLQLHWQEQ